MKTAKPISKTNNSPRGAAFHSSNPGQRKHNNQSSVIEIVQRRLNTINFSSSTSGSGVIQRVGEENWNQIKTHPDITNLTEDNADWEIKNAIKSALGWRDATPEHIAFVKDKLGFVTEDSDPETSDTETYTDLTSSYGTIPAKVVEAIVVGYSTTVDNIQNALDQVAASQGGNGVRSFRKKTTDKVGQRVYGEFKLQAMGNDRVFATSPATPLSFTKIGRGLH